MMRIRLRAAPAGEMSSDSAGGPLLSELGGTFTLKEGKRTALKPFSWRKRCFEWLWQEFNIRLRRSAAHHGGSDGPQVSPSAPVGILEVLLSSRKGKTDSPCMCRTRRPISFEGFSFLNEPLLSKCFLRIWEAFHLACQVGPVVAG